MTYKVLVDTNAHYMDARERRTLGEYADATAALAAARAVVDRDLAELHRPGMSADELFHLYTLFGLDPFISSDDAACAFSAWDYARTRSRELCQDV